MPNNKRRKEEDREAVIARARAGIIFASDHVAAELLAATSRIARALEPYVKSAKLVPDDRPIREILIDLRHYCDSKGLVFDELNAAAEEEYWDEKADLV
jgi:hypothetical protein